MSEPNDDDNPWGEPVLTSTSTPADLERAIAEWAAWSLRETRALAEEWPVSDKLRDEIMRTLEPIIWQRMRDALTSGYLRIHAPH